MEQLPSEKMFLSPHQHNQHKYQSVSHQEMLQTEAGFPDHFVLCIQNIYSLSFCE